MKTNRIVPVVAVTITILGAAACRQPDGTMPMPDEEQVDRIEDLSRDLQNVAARNETAPKELAEDLEVIGRMPVPPERVQELVRALETSLQGKTVSDDAAKRLAESMFVVMAARQLSDSQIETLQTDVTSQVKALGADDAAATSVASAAGRLQEDIRTSRRRWYQWF